MPPNTQNALNPIATNLQIPTGLFRDPSGQSDTVWHVDPTKKTANSFGLGNYGLQYAIQNGQARQAAGGGGYEATPGSMYSQYRNEGDFGKALFQQQSGVSFDNVPGYQGNIADLFSSGSGYTRGSLNPNDISSLLSQKPGVQQVPINTQSNQLAAPTQALQAAQAPSNVDALLARGQAMLAQTKSQGSTPFSGSPSGQTGQALTPEQQAAYFKSQSNAATPMSPAQYLASLQGNAQAPTNPVPPQNGTQVTPPPYNGSTGLPAPQSGLPGAGNQYEQSILNNMRPTSQESNLQTQLDALTAQQAGINASRDLGIQAVGEQPIAMSFIAGQGKAIEDRAAVKTGALGAQAVPLTQQLARLQQQRQSALDIDKFQLERQDVARSAEAKLAEQKRQESVITAKDQAVLDQNAAKLKTETDLANKKFEEDKRQFGAEYALKQKELNQKISDASAVSEADKKQAATGISLVNEILAGNPNSITGVGQLLPSITNPSTYNKYTQLKSVLALGSRQLLKGSGAVSDYESRTLDAASSALGRNLSNQDFSKELKKVRGVMSTNAGLDVTVKLSDSSGNSQKIRTNGAGVYQAIQDGLTVEYE